VELEQAAIAAAQPAISVQAAKIEYRRPDSWGFWFGAKIISGVPSNVGGDLIVVVDVDVIPGVGRTSFSTQQEPAVLPGSGIVSFCQFRWRIPATVNPARTRMKWSTLGRTPLLDDDDPDSGSTVDRIVAQDLQCQAKLQVQGASLGSARVSVTTLFAPICHMRPGWWRNAIDGD
jgi:hypothetical protein